MWLTLKDVLNKDILVTICTNKQFSSFIKVKEDSPDSKIKELTITNLPENIIAFSLDYKDKNPKKDILFRQLSYYVDNTKSGVNKRCDLIIVWLENSKLYALVLDLKSGRPSIQETNKQLQNSELFLKYLLQLVNLHKDECHVPIRNIDSPVIRKAIVVTKIRLSKRPVHFGNNPIGFFSCHVEVDEREKASAAFSQLVPYLN